MRRPIHDEREIGALIVWQVVSFLLQQRKARGQVRNNANPLEVALGAAPIE